MDNQYNNNSVVPLIARVLLSLIFLMSGISKIFNFGQTASYMSNVGLPIPEILLAATIVIEVIGGIMIVLGWGARWAGLIIFLWLIPTTFLFHAFWDVPPDRMRSEMNSFMKNIAIMGGMLYIWAFGSGPFSLDNRRKPNKDFLR